MESDSSLSILALAVSVLLLAVSELGTAAIAARIGSLSSSIGSNAGPERRSLRRIADLPSGPTAPLRLASMASFAGALISSVAFTISTWGVNWGLVAVAALLGLIIAAAASLLGRSAGVKYADRVCSGMATSSWLLSIPLRPALALQSLVSRDSGRKSLDFSMAVDSNDEPLDEHEVRMIRGVVQLDKTVAREIMVPRVDIVAVEETARLEELAEEMNVAGHSRIPVYKGDLDHIEGVAHARDVLQQLSNGDANGQMTAKQVSREPLFIPESKNLEQLLDEFQERRTHLAVVVDEYGGVSGIVTIEDLLEEIVGEIHDEFDTYEPEIQRISEFEFLVDARLPIDELNESMKSNVVGEGFDTIGGLLFDQLGKVPVPGDSVKYDGLSIEVVDTVGRRPKTLRITTAN